MTVDFRYRPISPPVAVGQRGSDLPAYLSNGLIGLRIVEDPLANGLCLINGFAGVHHERKVEAAAVAPFPLGLDLALDGLWAGEQGGAVEAVDQAYDFAVAELTTRARVRLCERTATLETVAFCSRTHPAVVCQQVTVTVDAACELDVRFRLAVAGVRGRLVERRIDTPGEDEPVCDGSVLWESEGALGRCGLALFTTGPDNSHSTHHAHDDLGPTATTWRLRSQAGHTYRFHRLVSLVPDVLHRQPQRQAVRLVANAGELGFDALRARNQAAWVDLWHGRIRLVGADDRWQALADAAFFYLNTSVHGSSPASTSIYGLATWRDYHYYFGHVMWDVDAFAVPPLALIQPDAARALVDFRSRSLEAARRNARLQGRVGLQFPWEASPATGEEATPGGAAAAAREIHVNLHVARAFAILADAAGDPAFLHDNAWPVLQGVSDWVVDRIEADGNRFVFRELGGPAENPGFIDEDAVTTLAARLVLEKTLEVAGRLGREPGLRWAEVAKGLHPPMRANGAIASHAGFRLDESKGATPSPLMAIHPFNVRLDPETEHRTLELYLSRWEDYVGSPMLAALYGVWAARTGDRALSLKLLEEGYGLYDHGRFHQTLEFRLDKLPGTASGPFFANIGGFVGGLLTGFPGLELDSGDPLAWPRRPVILPEGWEAIECDRLWVRGRQARLVARQGAERAKLSFNA